MSRPTNGSNGNSNGYYSQGASNRYDEEREDGGLIEGGRERRAGGYGGFVSDSLLAPEGHEQTSFSRRGASESRERNALDHNNSKGPSRSVSGSRQIEGQ